MARRPKLGPGRYQFMAGKRQYGFAAQVDDIVKATEKRMTALVRMSVQDVINDAQTPGISVSAVKAEIAAGIMKGGGKRRSKKRFGPITMPENKGGKMRVDTGFLRASGQLSLKGMPTGPVRGDPDKSYSWNDKSVATVLTQYKLGLTLFWGWTASYAKYREAFDGFLESALQKWPEIVARNCEKIKTRIPK